MPEILRQIAGDGVAGTEDMPPRFMIKFEQNEFADFLANPVQVLQSLGHSVDNLTVHLSNSAWDIAGRRWIKAAARAPVTLPPSATWRWECGYEDEMCVCYQVLDL